MALSEFSIIEQYFKRATLRSDVIAGIGDDGAVVRTDPGMVLVSVMDTLVSGVHFPIDTSPGDIGYKALAVNLSDIAAMGAEPAWATLALTLPEADAAWIEQFSAGFFALADEFDVALIGGDTTRGPLAVTVQVQGQIDKNNVLRRKGAQVGDLVYVTGTFGDAAAGLRGLEEDPGPNQSWLQSRLNRPSPRIKEGRMLPGLASACIDVSDGLLADANHLCNASRVGIELHGERLPMSEALREVYPDPLQRLGLALSGGDDYELCFTVSPDTQGALEAAFVGLQSIECIGTVVEGNSTRVVDAIGQPIEIESIGYRHF